MLCLVSNQPRSGPPVAAAQLLTDTNARCEPCDVVRQGLEFFLGKDGGGSVHGAAGIAALALLERLELLQQVGLALAGQTRRHRAAGQRLAMACGAAPRSGTGVAAGTHGVIGGRCVGHPRNLTGEVFGQGLDPFIAQGGRQRLHLRAVSRALGKRLKLRLDIRCRLPSERRVEAVMRLPASAMAKRAGILRLRPGAAIGLIAGVMLIEGVHEPVACEQLRALEGPGCAFSCVPPGAGKCLQGFERRAVTGAYRAVHAAGPQVRGLGARPDQAPDSRLEIAPPAGQEAGGNGADAGQGPGVDLGPVVIVELRDVESFLAQGLGVDARESACGLPRVIAELRAAHEAHQDADAAVWR
ncbi:hypothetical protein WR25_15955 [Diploscapter pachys]|uniref:Uncharacterized protein n=1 Tax=Diploscapter pachys TaxID=2018661 RepID=A0A2A2KET4_9BILA|nr:hypothetical protein WR25_15955 [Diploscapter pachys]